MQSLGSSNTPTSRQLLSNLLAGDGQIKLTRKEVSNGQAAEAPSIFTQEELNDPNTVCFEADGLAGQFTAEEIAKLTSAEKQGMNNFDESGNVIDALRSQFQCSTSSSVGIVAK